MQIQLYAAPLEGVSYGVWRHAHRSVFGGVDRYYAPFITPNNSMRFQTKDLRELGAGESDLVPQILTNRSDYFLWAAVQLHQMGYEELNLNLGCPSGTVVAKHKGSGALREPKELDKLLDGIFSGLPTGMRLSVKTRIGMKSTDEWPTLLEVFERYPISELTIHPRLQNEFYHGYANREIFRQTMGKTNLPLVYNGDVTTPADPAFGWGSGVMVGRGLVGNPALLRQVRSGPPARREELEQFHELLLEGYRAYMPGEQPLLHRLKEFWRYFSASFAEADKELKRLQKARSLTEYRSAAMAILQQCSLKSEREAEH